jgi:hypothetical protein
MKTHNVSIFHCASCGRVVHAELDAEPPQCCGQAMAVACEDSVREGDATEVTAKRHSQAEPPKPHGEAKPR